MADDAHVADERAGVGATGGREQRVDRTLGGHYTIKSTDSLSRCISFVSSFAYTNEPHPTHFAMWSFAHSNTP